MKIDSKLKGLSGIYQIRNVTNNKVYVGRTKCLYTRSCHHRENLIKKNKTQVNDYFLKAVTKYGINNFVFEVLEISNDNLVEKEYEWIILKNSTNRKLGYNIRNDRDGITNHNPLTILRLRNSRIEFYKDLENRKKLSEIIKKTCWNSFSKLERINNGRSKDYSKKAKYKYFINDEGPYRCYQIKESEYKSVIAMMWKRKTNVIVFKGSKIERVIL